MKNSRTWLVLSLIALTALARIAPHPLNFTPVAALALFAGAHLRDRRLAYLAPLAAVFLGDLRVGFHIMLPFVYACFAATVAIGEILKAHRKKLPPVAGATLTASVLFFVVTNFAWWALGGAYPMSLAGLGACFANAIPFFRNTLAGDALYTAILFGGMALAEKKFPVLAEAAMAHER